MSNVDDLPTDEFAPVRKLPVQVEARLVEERREVHTREGTIVADPGDVLMRGIEGELYPCDPDIFEATYEIVDRSKPTGKIVFKIVDDDGELTPLGPEADS